MWTIKIAAGTYSLKENILIFNVQNLTIQGANLYNSAQTTLVANGLPSTRTTLEYFSIIISNASAVSLRGFKLSGNLLSGTRAIAVCALNGSSVKNLSIDHLQFKDYNYFNFIAGNSIATDNLTAIKNDFSGKTVPVAKQPLQAFANYLATIPQNQLFCGGPVQYLNFTYNTVYMRSVGFYFVPPTYQMSQTYVMPAPDPSASQVPAWYQAARQKASSFINVVVTGNSFLNDQTDPNQVAASDYHSALKLGMSLGMKISKNTIDAHTLPEAFQSGAAINIAADCYDAVVDSNTITLPSGNSHPNGVGIQLYYQRHEYYGFGTTKVFAAVNGTSVTNNRFNYAGIRLSDCCVQQDSTSSDLNLSFDGRPYCEERDALLQKGLYQESLFVGYNYKNGKANQDANLIFKASGDTAWVQYYEGLEASGQGGIYCRQYLGVTYASKDGVLLLPKR